MTALALLTPDALQDLVREAVKQGIQAATAKQTLNLTEAASHAGVSTRTITRKVRDGSFPHPVDGRWSRVEIDRWARERNTEAQRREASDWRA